MSMSNTTENAVLKAILQGTDPPWRAGATQYLALFTADPGETASLVAEANYTGYSRVALPNGTAWDHLTHQGGSGDIFLVAAAGGDMAADILSGDLAMMKMDGNLANTRMDGNVIEQAMGGSIIDSMGGTMAALPLGGNISDERLAGGIA